MSESPPNAPIQDALLRRRDAARMLGVSPRTIDHWVRLHRIPFVRLGSGPRSPLRFRLGDLRAWIDVQTRQPQADESDIFLAQLECTHATGRATAYVLHFRRRSTLLPLASIAATLTPGGGLSVGPVRLTGEAQAGVDWEALANSAVQEHQDRLRATGERGAGLEEMRRPVPAVLQGVPHK